MNPRIRKVAAIAGALTIASGASYGAAQAATSSKDGTSKTTRKGPGPRNANVSALARELGVTTAKLRAALEATRPAKPAAGERADRRSEFAAAIAKALGVETAAVQEILDDDRPARPAERPAPGTKPAKPDQTALIKALADGLNKTEAEVKSAIDAAHAAHEAEHDARHAEMAAALAKELGLSTEKVQAALEKYPLRGGPGGHGGHHRGR